MLTQKVPLSLMELNILLIALGVYRSDYEGADVEQDADGWESVSDLQEKLQNAYNGVSQ